MLTASDAADMAVKHVTELTKRVAEGVVGAERTEDGWRITVEVVETHRIPDSADIIALYEADVDADGDLGSYRRVGRYLRGHVDQK